MSNVVRFTGITNLDLDPNLVLQEAIDELDGVVILGYDKDGDEYFASSIADGGEVNWILDRAKAKLINIVDE